MKKVILTIPILIYYAFLHCYNLYELNNVGEVFHSSQLTPQSSLLTTHHSLLTDHSSQLFYIVSGSLFITSFIFDQEIRDFTQNEIYGGDNLFTEILHGVGNRDYFFYGALTVHSVDTILQNNYFHNTLMLSLQSLLVTQGITETFKKTFKRARPSQSPDDPYDFFEKGESFFSGHSSGAWSYLTVVAGRHPEIKWLAYSFAGCVSLSRIYEDAHWASDVIFGAMVGYGVGQLTLRFSPNYTNNLNILPYIDENGGRYVLVQWGF